MTLFHFYGLVVFQSISTISSLSVHLSVNGHLGCFYDLNIVNTGAVNTGVYVSF